MQFGFDTESVEHGRAALLLYAMFKSRDRSSSLNGLETWSRFTSYIRGASLKSRTTAEFVQNFCRMAKISSIRPRYLTEGGFVQLPTGELIASDNIKDYRLSLFENNDLMGLYEKEGVYLTMLVRERIQRERLMGMEDIEDEDQD